MTQFAKGFELTAIGEGGLFPESHSFWGGIFTAFLGAFLDDEDEGRVGLLYGTSLPLTSYYDCILHAFNYSSDVQNRAQSTVYWNSNEEKEDALAKAEERDESLSSLVRKIIRKLPRIK